MVKGFLDSRTIRDLQGAMRQGFQTVQDFQDPEVVITIQRTNQETGVVTTLDPQTVVMRFENRVPATDGPVSSAQQADSITIRKFAPFDVEAGDEYIYSDQRYVVGEVFPVRFGVIRAAVRRWSGRP